MINFQQFQPPQLPIPPPTLNIKHVLSFYQQPLPLKPIPSFHHHQPYHPLILPLPHHHLHLQITKHQQHQTFPLPHPHHLLLFYIPDEQQFHHIKNT
ncbi:VOC family protein, partial [Bacillus altitudinis]|uniref:VOC family protein n=1 Tax=Bacillus altitudinis TaxID=293387 RepID=UPI003B51F4E4